MRWKPLPAPHDQQPSVSAPPPWRLSVCSCLTERESWMAARERQRQTAGKVGETLRTEPSAHTDAVLPVFTPRARGIPCSLSPAHVNAASVAWQPTPGSRAGPGDKKHLWQGPWWGAEGSPLSSAFLHTFPVSFFCETLWLVSLSTCVCVCVWKGSAFSQVMISTGWVETQGRLHPTFLSQTSISSFFAEVVLLLPPRHRWQSHDSVIDTLIRREWPAGHWQHSLTAGRTTLSPALALTSHSRPPPTLS